MQTDRGFELFDRVSGRLCSDTQVFRCAGDGLPRCQGRFRRIDVLRKPAQEPSTHSSHLIVPVEVDRQIRVGDFDAVNALAQIDVRKSCAPRLRLVADEDILYVGCAEAQAVEVTLEVVEGGFPAVQSLRENRRGEEEQNPEGQHPDRDAMVPSTGCRPAHDSPDELDRQRQHSSGSRSDSLWLSHSSHRLTAHSPLEYTSGVVYAASHPIARRGWLPVTAPLGI